MNKHQKINCTVESCAYNNDGNQECNLEEIVVEPCYDCNNGEPEDESMCGSYKQDDGWSAESGDANDSADNPDNPAPDTNNNNETQNW